MLVNAPGFGERTSYFAHGIFAFTCAVCCRSFTTLVLFISGPSRETRIFRNLGHYLNYITLLKISQNFKICQKRFF